MAKIPLSSGGFFEVDDADVALVSGHKWRKCSYGYAIAKIRGNNVSAHALLLPVEDGMVRDHINGDKLNNCRANLRLATPLQNSQNVGKRKDNKSGYKGVYWNKQFSHWRSQIRHGGKRVFLGRFDDVIAAAKAYDRAAVEYFGDFARLNFNS